MVGPHLMSFGLAAVSAISILSFSPTAFAESDLQDQQVACAQTTSQQKEKAKGLLNKKSPDVFQAYLQQMGLEKSDFQAVWCLPHSAVQDPSYTLQDLHAYVSNTVLTLAIQAGNVLLVRYLAENQLVDINQKTYRVTSDGFFGKEWSGFTPLHLARNPSISLRKKIRQQIIQILVTYGARD